MMRHRLAVIASSVFLGSFFCSAQTSSQATPVIKNVEFRIRLLAPLTTKLNRKGDLVSAAVVEPASFDGDILEGEVGEIKAGTAQKTASVQFQFHTLHFSGKSMPVSTAVLNVANSKHELGVDEQGTQLESDKGALGNGKLSTLGSALSKFHMGGGKSAGPGAYRLQAHSPNLSLAVGSEMVVQINSKAGHD